MRPFTAFGIIGKIPSAKVLMSHVLTFAVIAIILVVVVPILFFVLQHFSDKTYRPTVDDIRGTIQATIDETIELPRFDEFSCVRIAYNPRFEAIRHRYNEILGSKECLSGDARGPTVAPINEAGKEKLRELLLSLNEAGT
jgi:hypothetical protein